MRRDFEDFLLYKHANDGASDRTICAYRDILARFERWLDGRDPWNLSDDDVLTFTGPYLFKVLKLQPISRTPYVACIRGLYAWHAMLFGSRNSAARVATAVTGIAGPTGGVVGKPVGTVWFAWCLDGATFSERCHFDGGRAAVRVASLHHTLKRLAHMLGA